MSTYLHLILKKFHQAEVKLSSLKEKHEFIPNQLHYRHSMTRNL